MAEEWYTSFFGTRPFWVGSRLDLHDSAVKERFHELMCEIVLDYQEDGFRLCICRDGLMMLRVDSLESCVPSKRQSDSEEWIQWWSEYLEYVRSFLFLLDCSCQETRGSSPIEVSNITNRDVFRVLLCDGMPGAFRLAQGSVARVYQDQREVGGFRGNEFWLNRRPILDRIALDFAVALLSETVKSRRVIRSMSMLARSVAEYKTADYTTSLVLAWMIIESEILSLWEEHLKEREDSHDAEEPRIGRKRRERLDRLRSSTVADVLELADVLPLDVLRRVEAVRGYRNRTLHSGGEFVCTPEQCREAIELAADSVVNAVPYQLDLNLSYRVYYG